MVNGIGRWLLVIFAAVSLLGTAAGVYASLHGDIVEMETRITDLSREVDRIAEVSDRWRAEEKNYDTEVRNRVETLDREVGAALNRLADKIDAIRTQFNQPKPDEAH